MDLTIEKLPLPLFHQTIRSFTTKIVFTMNTPVKFFLHKESVLSYLKSFGQNLTKYELAWDGMEYISFALLQESVWPKTYNTLVDTLPWYTENDVKVLGDSVQTIYKMNPNTPETASLVKVVESNNTHVKYVNLYDPNQGVYQLSNRAFVMNSVKV